MNNKIIGNYGEDLAYKFLLSRNYKVLEKNYSNSLGEIDLICKKNDLIIFVEVKSRLSDKFGIPCESVTHYKQHQILKVSLSYIKRFNLYNINFRYDIIELYFDTIHKKYKLRHIKNAFSFN